ERDAGELLATAARLGAEKNRAEQPLSRPEKLTGEKSSHKGSLVIIIDDAGYDLHALDAFLALPFPLTIAVLPGLPHSAEAARRTLVAGKELILHQPMEALGGEDPGPRAITLAMKADEATRIVQKNLDSLPGVLGINNHMGSALTRDHELMVAVLELAKARGIYYVDSLTAPGTVTKVIARSESMTTWERSVFLDNSPEKALILRAISEGKKKAETGSPAIMIGHVWSQELASTLQELYPMLTEEGFSLSTIARLMLEEAHARSRN
ncbi:MAG: divergent polysaccharide deacetylase family protein, partial [Spirochaetota bacterium]